MSNEKGAIALLTRAVELDSKKQWTSALVCYKEGLQLLLEAIRTETSDSAKKSRFREKANEYMQRAEALQKTIDGAKKSGTFHEQVEILDDSVGHSYEALFGQFLDCDVTTVLIEDPYIRAHHQIVNLLRFMELVLRKCPCVKHIHLKTGPDAAQKEEQLSKLNEMSSQLKSLHKVDFTHEFSATLHDRQIKLNTGWIIKIGRGLDIYKSSKSKWTPGFYDMNLRPCLQTTIDIFYGDSAIKK